jgi:hypothetical protein
VKSASCQFDEKRPSRALEELRRIAATRMERRLFVQVMQLAPVRTDSAPEAAEFPVGLNEVDGGSGVESVLLAGQLT